MSLAPALVTDIAHTCFGQFVVAVAKWQQDFALEANALNRFGINIYVPRMARVVPSRINHFNKVVPEKVEVVTAIGAYAFIPVTEGWERVYMLDSLDYVVTRLGVPVTLKGAEVARIKYLESEGAYNVDPAARAAAARIDAGSFVEVAYGERRGLRGLVTKIEGPWAFIVDGAREAKLPRTVLKVWGRA